MLLKQQLQLPENAEFVSRLDLMAARKLLVPTFTQKSPQAIIGVGIY